MVNVVNELKKLGIEVSDEQKESLKKSMGEELYSKKEMEDKVNKASSESEQWKTRAESAEKMLEGLDGKSPEDILKERDDWKRQAEDSKKDLKTTTSTKTSSSQQRTQQLRQSTNTSSLPKLINTSV